MRAGRDLDAALTASHMPSQAGCRFLLAEAAAEDYAVSSWYVPGAYPRVPNDPRLRVTMPQPPRADGSYIAPGMICMIRRAMPEAPDVNAHAVGEMK